MSIENPNKANSERVRQTVAEIKKILEGKEPNPDFLLNIDDELDSILTPQSNNSDIYKISEDRQTEAVPEKSLTEKYQNSNFKTGAEWRNDTDSEKDDD